MFEALLFLVPSVIEGSLSKNVRPSLFIFSNMFSAASCIDFQKKALGTKGKLCANNRGKNQSFRNILAPVFPLMQKWRQNRLRYRKLKVGIVFGIENSPHGGCFFSPFVLLTCQPHCIPRHASDGAIENASIPCRLVRPPAW